MACRRRAAWTGWATRGTGLLLAAIGPLGLQAQAAEVLPYTVVGDAIPAALSPSPGNAERGRAIVADRRVGQCLLCHPGPFPEPHLQGNLAPHLAGSGRRWSEGQLRLRIVDARRLNPASPMPAYHRSEGLTQVASAWRGRPVLDAQQVEDVVAFLRTLVDPPPPAPPLPP